MKPSLTIRQEAERFSLLIALLLVMLTAVFTYRTWATFERVREDALITRRFVDGIIALQASLADAETGQRGFLLTGNDRYLDPYRQAVTAIPANLDALARIDASRRHPLQTQRIDKLKPLVRAKMDELAQSIELRRSQGLDAALSIVRNDRGKADMDQIRAICAEIQTASDNLLARQREEVRATAYQTGLVGTVGSSAVFVLLVPATITIRRGTEHRQHLIQDLQRSEETAKEARDLLQTTISSIGDGVITAGQEGK